MRRTSPAFGRGSIVVMGVACLAFGAACGSSKGAAASSATTPGSITASAPGATTSAPAGVAGQVPSSCAAISTSLIGSYIGGVATTRSIGTTPHSVSCEFANAGSSKILILNIGSGATSATFAASRAAVAKGGVTTASIGALGSEAFSISRNGVPGGVEVLTDQGQVFAVTANLPFAQDESLIQQLMKTY